MSGVRSKVTALARRVPSLDLLKHVQSGALRTLEGIRTGLASVGSLRPWDTRDPACGDGRMSGCPSWVVPNLAGLSSPCEPHLPGSEGLSAHLVRSTTQRGAARGRMPWAWHGASSRLWPPHMQASLATTHSRHFAGKVDEHGGERSLLSPEKVRVAERAAKSKKKKAPSGEVGQGADGEGGGAAAATPKRIKSRRAKSSPAVAPPAEEGAPPESTTASLMSSLPGQEVGDASTPAMDADTGTGDAGSAELTGDGGVPSSSNKKRGRRRDGQVSSRGSSGHVITPAEVATILEKAHGVDVAVVDVSALVDWTQAMVVATGTSPDHLKRMATAVQEELKTRTKPATPQLKTGTKPAKGAAVPPTLPGIEDPDSRDWLLVDAGSMVVHLMSERAREYYQLDKLWRSMAAGKLPREEGETPPDDSIVV